MVSLAAHRIMDNCHIFLPTVLAVSFTNNGRNLMEKGSEIRRIKHPDSHQLACTVNEQEGQIEIVQGKNITLLKMQPGPLKVLYTRKKA